MAERDNFGRFIKGHTYNLGKTGNYGKFPRTSEYRQKLSIAGTGRVFDEETKDKIRKTRIGKRNSPRTEFKVGEEHPFWRNGASYKKRRISTKKWRETRKIVYMRDNWTCQVCGIHCNKSGKSAIQCHHIIPYRISKDDSISNLVTLCRSCHSKVDMAYGK